MLKLIALSSFKQLTPENAIRYTENVIGSINFDKKTNLIVNDIRLPWVMSYSGSNDVAERIDQFATNTVFSVERKSTFPIKLGQIQCLFSDGVPLTCNQIIKDNEAYLMSIGNDVFPSMVERGSGMRSVSFRRLSDTMGVVEFTYDVNKSNGANRINGVAEKLGETLKELLHCEVKTRILSNEDKQRRSTVSLSFQGDIPIHIKDALVYFVNTTSTDRTSLAYREVLVSFLDGVQPVIEATGNDWRGVDASVLTEALESPLFTLKSGDGVTSLACTMPLSTGIVGGVLRFPGAEFEVTDLHPTVAEDISERAVLAGMLSVLSSFDQSGTSHKSMMGRGDNETLGTGLHECVPLDYSSKERLRVRHIPTIDARIDAVAAHVEKDKTWFDYLKFKHVDPKYTHAMGLGFIPRITKNGGVYDITPSVVEEPSVIAAGSLIASSVDNVRVDTFETEESYDISIEFDIEADRLKTSSTSGEEYIDGMMKVYEFAELNKARACTQNKGFMNGLDPILMALDIHKSPISTALYQQFFKDGRVWPFLRMERSEKGITVKMNASLPKIPFINGGQFEWAAKNCDLMGNPTPKDLAELVLISGCFSTVAALKALGSKGINWGHMKLHERGI